MKNIYANPTFELQRDRFIEGGRTATAGADRRLVTADGTVIDATVDDRFPQLSTDSPLVDALYGIAIRDHERLVITQETYFYMLCNRFGRGSKIPEGFLPEGPVFWAGYGFNTFLYTRDTAYSSWLGTAHLLPEVVRSHLLYLRRLRRQVGLKVSQRHAISIAGLPTEELDRTERELADTYNTNCYTRRTDDIVWVLGLWEVYLSTRDTELLHYLLEEFDYFDTHFYRYFFDQADGLYRGQATFIDVGGPCYPGRGPGETVLLKALSTNCLYAGCLGLLARAARLLGQDDRAEDCRQRRDRLAAAIRASFGAHGYPFYKDEEGGFSDRREMLGTAFLSLFDVLPAGECAALLAGYPDGDFGRPLVWPFYGSKGVYHDNSTWPFANTIFALAEYKTGNRQCVIRKTLGKLARHALNGDFNEVLEFRTGAFVGCPGYIWSAASYLAVIYRMIAGLQVGEAGTVSFAPVLPPELGDRFALTGLKIGAMTLDLRLRGQGESVVTCRIDGEPSDRPVLAPDAGKHDIEIELG